MTNNKDNNGLNSQGFDYDFLVEESLKNVVKKVLKITSETGLVFGFRDFTFDFTPTVTSDDMLTDLKFGFQYDWKLFDDITIVPYSELHYNDDFSEGDKVIGIKTTIKLF